MVLYCQTGGIGDAILGLPIYDWVVSQFGDCEVGYWDERAADVLRCARDARLRSMKGIWRHELRRVIPKLGSEGIGLVVLNTLTFDADGDLNLFYAVSPSWLSYARERREEHLRLIRQASGRHWESLMASSDEVLRFLNFETDYYADFRRFGMDVSYEKLQMPVPEVAKRSWIMLHDSRLPYPGGGSGYLMKTWFIERWEELSERLHARGLPLVQMRSAEQPLFPHCREASDVLREEMGGAEPRFWDYLRLLAQCRLYIGTDSWPAHAAILLPQTRFILLKGAVCHRWDHSGRFSRIVRKGRCQACEGLPGAVDECFWGLDRRCMRDISPEEIEILAIKELEDAVH